MGLSSHVSRGLLAHLLTNTPYTPPPATYLGLHTGPPDHSPELDSPYYSRAAITFSDHGGVFHSNETIEYPNLPYLPDPITHYAVYDSPTPGTGSLILDGELESPIPARGGETLHLDPNAITVV